MESSINTPIYNVPTLGIVGANGSLSLEEAKKMKKKMGMEMPDEEIPEEEPMDDEEDLDAETGDGEVVDPASEKDDPEAEEDIEAETPPEEDEEEVEPGMEESPLMRMKKKMSKMKKKMAADADDCKKKFGKAPAKKKEDKKKDVKKEDVAWWNSLQNMLKQPENVKGSGFGFRHNEDALYPEIDINTGLIKKPEATE